MSEPSPGWIARVPVSFAEGPEKLTSRIRALLATPDDAALDITVADSLDLSAWSGRDEKLLLLRARDDHPLLSRVRENDPLRAERNRYLVTFDPRSDDSSSCGTLDIPKGSQGAKNIHVAVIDGTRVDELGTSILHIFDVREGVVGPMPDPLPPDSYLHGRGVAGLLAHNQHGTAKGAEVWCYRVKTAWDMMKALEDIRDHTKVRVVCAAVALKDGIPTDGRDEVQALHDVIQYVSERNPDPIFVVVSAGNKKGALMKSPAAAPAAITVGALVDDVDIVSSLGAKSSGKPTLLAPVVPKTATVNGDCWDGSTSVAAPYVAGLIATWLEERASLTRQELLTVLQQASTTLDGPTIEEQGWGKLNVRKALSLIRELPTAPAPTPPPAPSTPEKAAPRRRRRKAPAST